MKLRLSVIALLTAMFSMQAAAITILSVPDAEQNHYEILEDERSNEGGTTIHFNLDVGEGVEPVTAFAVGFEGDLFSNTLSAYTKYTDWYAFVGAGTVPDDAPAEEGTPPVARADDAPAEKSSWDLKAKPLFDGLTWEGFLDYDRASAGQITHFALFYTQPLKGDGSSYPYGIDSAIDALDLFGKFYVTDENLDAFSPTVIATANGGVFGGPAGRQVLAVTNTPNDIPEPASIALFGFGLVGLTVLRKKKLSS